MKINSELNEPVVIAMIMFFIIIPAIGFIVLVLVQTLAEYLGAL